jgi:hypothetical protein
VYDVDKDNELMVAVFVELPEVVNVFHDVPPLSEYWYPVTGVPLSTAAGKDNAAEVPFGVTVTAEIALGTGHAA